MSVSELDIQENFLKEVGFELRELKESNTRQGERAHKGPEASEGWHAGGTASVGGTQKARGTETRERCGK